MDYRANAGLTLYQAPREAVNLLPSTGLILRHGDFPEVKTFPGFTLFNRSHDEYGQASWPVLS